MVSVIPNCNECLRVSDRSLKRSIVALATTGGKLLFNLISHLRAHLHHRDKCFANAKMTSAHTISMFGFDSRQGQPTDT